MTKNIQLTKNFWLKEYFKDRQNPQNAIKLYNACTPLQEVLAYELALDEQVIRDFINGQHPDDGDIGIVNTSGYRDCDLNRRQHGSADLSLHTLFRGVDFKAVDHLKRVVPEHLKKIYTFVTKFSNLNFRECFLYVTEDEAVPTNLHYAKLAPRFTDRRYGIYVRSGVPNGKPMRLDRYLTSLSSMDGAVERFQRKLGLKP